ncbi:MAG: sulfur carrier protein ThiS [Proteobacteria bacterium]|nr:sulfur carrier protein ThiS [Pseudomonadota bacterium]
MRINVNGQCEDLDEGLTILGFLHVKKLEPREVVVELNRTIIIKDDFDTLVLKENDNLEVLRFVGGG